jgi:hypothetical protein
MAKVDHTELQEARLQLARSFENGSKAARLSKIHRLFIATIQNARDYTGTQGKTMVIGSVQRMVEALGERTPGGGTKVGRFRHSERR